LTFVRATACVGDEHFAHRDAGALRQRAEARRERLVLQRPEAVEERLEDDRRDEREQEHGQRERHAGRQGPPARERPRERHRRRPCARSQNDGHGEALGSIAEPAADALRREAPPALAPPAAPEGKRRPDDAREHRDKGGVRCCGGHRRERSQRGEEPVPERGPRQRGEQAGGERQVREQREIERPVVGARPGAFVRGEVVVHPHRAYVRNRVEVCAVFRAQLGKQALHFGRKEG
jgi:hypothetical protein